MARNRKYAVATQLELAPTVAPGARALSGDPVLVGQIPGAMLTDADDTIANGGKGTVQMDGAFSFVVHGHDGTDPASGAVGDIVYNDEGVLNLDDSGVRFGYLLEDVAADARAPTLVKIGY